MLSFNNPDDLELELVAPPGEDVGYVCSINSIPVDRTMHALTLHDVVMTRLSLNMSELITVEEDENAS